MTDIEKKARVEARKLFFNANRNFLGNNGPLIAEAVEAGFDAGVTYALGNQWRDAEKEKPEDEHTKVIVATNFNCVMTGYWSEQIGWALDTAYPRAYGQVVAWQPMPKYKPKGDNQ